MGMASVGPRRLKASDHVSFNELAFARKDRNGLTVLTQIFEVKVDSFFDEFYYFFARLCYGDTTREIGDVRPPTRLAFFNDHKVTHLSNSVLTTGWHSLRESPLPPPAPVPAL